MISKGKRFTYQGIGVVSLATKKSLGREPQVFNNGGSMVVLQTRGVRVRDMSWVLHQNNQKVKETYLGRCRSDGFFPKPSACKLGLAMEDRQWEGLSDQGENREGEMIFESKKVIKRT